MTSAETSRAISCNSYIKQGIYICISIDVNYARTSCLMPESMRKGLIESLTRTSMQFPPQDVLKAKHASTANPTLSKRVSKLGQTFQLPIRLVYSLPILASNHIANYISVKFRKHARQRVHDSVEFAPLHSPHLLGFHAGLPNSRVFGC